ncbi:MAG: ABC transporter ATP-binding protein [Ferruginibacter sp.]
MKHILRNILAVLDKKEKKQFGLLILLDILISILDILSLALLLWIIRFYIQPVHDDLSFLPGWLADNRSFMFIAIFFFLFGIKNWAGYVISRSQFTFIGRIALRISRSNLVNYQQARFAEFVNIDSSSHIRHIAFQPFDFSQYMLSGIQQIITQISLILVTIIAIILFDIKLFVLLVLILLPPVIIVFYVIKKRLANAKRNIQVSNERSFRYLLDALKGYVESNIYDRNDFFLRRFMNARQTFSSHLFDSLALQTMPNRIIEIFAVLGLFILIVIAKWTGNNGSAMLIAIGAFMAAAYKIIPGIVKVINISGQMKAYEFALDEPEENKKTAAIAVKGPSASIQSIEFKNVGFQYEGNPVLQQLSFTVKGGDFIGISGESGKGKTTVLNLILGFLPASNGNIFINDIAVGIDEIKNYWPSIAYTRQQSFCIHDTLLRNITLEEEGYNKEHLQYALDMSGLGKLAMNFPEGLEKIITENGKNISGGQQQRIAIARALYKNASFILLDEPFNELDEEATQLLLEHFRALAADGKAVVMITHDKKSLSYCNKIISLDE